MPKFRRLLSAEGPLLVGVILLLTMVRIALSLLPFRWVRGALQRMAGSDASVSGKPSETRVNSLIRAVNRGSRFVPGATCLTQAVAAQLLLSWSGIPSQVHLGVRKSDSEFAAHAWVTCGGIVVLGGDVRPFTPLVRFERGAS